MLTSEQIEIISEVLTPLFDYLEQEVIHDIARRIQKTTSYTRTAELMAIEMRKLGYSPSRIRKECIEYLRKDKDFQKEVAKNTIEYKKDIKKLIDDIKKKAEKEGDVLIAQSGKMAWIDDLSVWKSNGVELKKDTRLKTLTKAMAQQLNGSIDNLTGTLGFKAVSGWESIETAYRKELDKAVIKIVTGTFDSRKPIKEIVRDLAKSGLRSVDYASGRTYQLDSAVRLAVRTGTHQLSGQIQKINIMNTGQNLVYVQAHENARNTGVGVANHEAWQGKVYYIEGSPEDYAEEAKRIGQDAIEDLWEKTGYSVNDKHENNPLGLYGYNCLHIINPWWEGVSELPTPIPPVPEVEYKGKTLDGYAQTQEMRRQEWTIRKYKREKEACTRMGLPLEEINERLARAEREYGEFCELCGVKPSSIRTSYEAYTADITKTEAYKRYQKMLKL